MTKAPRWLLAGFTLFLTEFAITAALGLLGVAGFLALSREVFDQDAAGFDAAAFRWTRQLLGPHRGWVEAVTFLASRNFIVVAAGLLVNWFLVRRRRWYSLLVPVVGMGSISLNLVLKHFYNRPRPLLPLVAAHGFSYPSGHAMISASFYGLLMYLVFTHVRMPRWRWLLMGALGLLVVLIGLTRVYLRVHYATDVLAGFTAGLLWLMLAVSVLTRVEKRVKKHVQQAPQFVEKQPE